MVGVANTRLLFNEIPQEIGYPDPEKSFRVDKSQQFDIDTVQLNGGIAVKVLVLSIDPFTFGRMKWRNRPFFSYTLNEPIDGYGVAVVIKSEDSSVSVGDHLTGIFPFAEYAILPNAAQHLKVENPGNHPWSIYVGVVGMPGQTAYGGYTEYIHGFAKEGETLFVSTGAGAVGSLVLQLAKKQGLKVIASAGSEDKVKFMQECGADVAFNYKTNSTKDILAQHGPINYYWDNVGGEALDCALEAAAPYARFVICGVIAGLESQQKPIKNYPHILFKSLTVQGFIATPLIEKYNDVFFKDIPPKVISGEIKYAEYSKRGLGEAGGLLLDVLTGKNVGKAIIVVADE